MFTFDNDSLFTGYIKQLLASFNLPSTKIYSTKDINYFKAAEKHNQKAGSPEDMWPTESRTVLASFIDCDDEYKNVTIKPDAKSVTDIGQAYIDIKGHLQVCTSIDPKKFEDKGYTYKYFYIKNNCYQYYLNNKWYKDKEYIYDKKEFNYTKRLAVKNNTYDSYTHEYLGDYLRFQRDYNNINLMPLYNCFNNILCQNLDIKKVATSGNKTIYEFNTDDPQYKIYMIPVKLFQKYTIAIDSESPVEMCCSLYSQYPVSREATNSDTQTESTNKLIIELAEELEESTYTKYNSMKFKNPIIFSKLYLADANELAVEGGTIFDSDAWNQDAYKKLLILREKDLKLFIKLPLNNNSSITILEGDYTGYNQVLYEITSAAVKTTVNKFKTNYAKTYEYKLPDESVIERPDTDIVPLNEREFKPYCELQLLTGNTGVSYPFADRLVEYLLDNTISSADLISDNIKRAQVALNKNNPEIVINGLWNDDYRNIIYDYMMNNNRVDENTKLDCLGYVDKDAEKYYMGKDRETQETVTISNVDLYPDIYLSNKNK